MLQWIRSGAEMSSALTSKSNQRSGGGEEGEARGGVGGEMWRRRQICDVVYLPHRAAEIGQTSK